MSKAWATFIGGSLIGAYCGARLGFFGRHVVSVEDTAWEKKQVWVNRHPFWNELTICSVDRIEAKLFAHFDTDAPNDCRPAEFKTIISVRPIDIEHRPYLKETKLQFDLYECFNKVLEQQADSETLQAQARVSLYLLINDRYGAPQE